MLMTISAAVTSKQHGSEEEELELKQNWNEWAKSTQMEIKWKIAKLFAFTLKCRNLTF